MLGLPAAKGGVADPSAALDVDHEFAGLSSFEATE